MRRSAALSAFLLLSVAPCAQAPFRAGTEIVPIYATVRGSDGHLLTDLHQNDFTILERGEQVPVAVFSNQPQPITLAMMVELSGNFEVSWHRLLLKGLGAFVDELGSSDRARIGTFTSNEIAVGFNLTADRAELHRVIDEEIWWGGGGGNRPLWNAIGAAMNSLANEPGRRVVLALVNGATDTGNLLGFPGLKQVEAAKDAGDVMVYAVSMFEGNNLTSDRNSESFSGRTLAQLVEATGGGYFRAVPGGARQYMRGPTDDSLVQRLAGVVEELRHQYALGFVPRHRDGRVGKVEVRVNRPGVTIAARKSYRAPEGAK